MTDKEEYDYITDTLAQAFRKEGTTREDIEFNFNAYGIPARQRVEILEKTMGVTKTFYTPEDISDEEKVECNLQMFTAGEWRVLSDSKRLNPLAIVYM